MGLAAMMAACSSEDVLTDVQNSQDSDLFAGIDKVEAGFEMGAESRLATKWDLEIGDRVGLAWLYDGEGKIQLTGEAYQNHPLYAEGGSTLKPKTSIYVGEYFSYAPYDESVVSIDKINFRIPVADMLSSWNGLAKNAIYISPKWTTVSKTGYAVDGEAGIDKTFAIYPRKFSNGVALNFDYENNKVDLRDETDNDKLYASDPEIFDAKITYVKGNNTVSINKFQYAPTEEPICDINWGNNINPLRNWETFKLAETLTANGTTPSTRALALNTVAVLNEVKDGYSLIPSKPYFATRDLDLVKFYMNALPAMTEVDDDTEIEIVINTTYGRITITKPVNEIAYTAYPDANGKTAYMAQPDGITKDAEGKDLAEGTYFDYTESFVQVLGKNGKFETEVDFSTAIMDGMHVRNDNHLIQLLRYYRDYKLGTKYEEDKVNLLLDADADGEFKISKTSIALMQSINTSGTNKIALHVCNEHGTPAIVVTNNAKEGKEVPSFNKVFGHVVDVYLQNQDWTWSQTSYKNTGNVATIYNRGNLTVTSANVEAYNKAASVFDELVNLGGAKINFTAGVATLWKIDLTNNGTINIPATAHMRVYSNVVNDVTELTGVRAGIMGIINNNGVFGAVEDQNGTIYNYGKIFHNAGAKTFITFNEDNEDFAKKLSEGTKIGIIEMKEADANVSVSNTSNKGIITYTWPKEKPVYESPAVVRFNYLIVEDDIEFAQTEDEIRYLEIKGADVYVTNKKGNLKNLQGVIVDKGYALNITEGNQLMPAKAAYIKGYVYNGGQFTYNKDVITYFGGIDADKENILKWTGF